MDASESWLARAVEATREYRRDYVRVVAMTVGTEGDVRPYVALGVGLRARGHTVRIATHATFEPLVRSHGLDFAELAGDPSTILRSADGRRWIASGADPLSFAFSLTRIMRSLLPRALNDAREACRGADLILGSILVWPGARSIGAHMDVPAYPAFLAPMTPTRAFANPFVPLPFTLGGGANRASHRAALFVLERIARGLPDEVPRGSRSTAAVPTLYGYSPLLVAKPRDWTAAQHVTGFWSLEDERWDVPAPLRDFLDGGPPPVYIGFGSMSSGVSQTMSDLVARAVARSGHRAIVLTGSGATMPSAPGLFAYSGRIPHEWLFSRVAAVVHHGGAGTVATTIRAGAPSVTVPFFADQLFWGRRLAALGVGVPPIPRSRLTIERLASAIRVAAENDDLRQRARELATAARTEHGVDEAVAIVERSAARSR